MTEQPTSGLRVLAGQSLAYLAGGLAGKALALITVPVLARLLMPAELGTLDVVASFASAFSIIVVAGTDNAVARFVTADDSPARLWASAFLAVGVLAVALVAVGVLARTAISSLLLSDASHGDLILVGLLYGVGATVFVVMLNLLRVRQASRRYAATTTVVLIAQMAGAVALAAANAGIGWILLWWGVASIAGGAWILISEAPPLGNPDPARMRSVLGFGLPLVPAVLGWVIGDLAIRAVLARSEPIEVLGDYSIASRIVSVMALLISGFSLAWLPFIFRVASGGSPTSHLRDVAVGLTSLLGLVAVTLGALAPEAARVLGGEEYVLAAAAVAPLAGGMLAFGLFNLLAGASGLAMRTKDVALASVVGVAVQVGVALVAVPALGLVGAGVASLAGYAVAMLLLLWWTGATALTWPMTMALTGSAIGLMVVSYLEQLDAGLALRLLPPAVLAAGLGWVLMRYRRTLVTQPTPT